MQEELQRIKSSTLGRKKGPEKPHQGSFIQTITDRLSDAKVILYIVLWIVHYIDCPFGTL
jgi:hypothetical protein